ncbi:PREDICTED: dickkopf-related protein 2-like [Cyprinodon variegatus]|uniref:dickkopf-related protein 2-like n=1 Tax=Cyprinodon variegatus TaxID=28743 RepID=UPI000742BB81|nr:PREDICTED: dickkopf-related protein 2-like [Cyprinodon variegatus]
MSLHLVLMVSVGVALLACARRTDARVRLNSIRTVILTEGHALPMNRSAWGPDMDLTLYQCMSDLECSEGNYCHIPTKGPTHSRCKACRRRNRRCQRDSMCCPGNRCNSNICVADVDSFLSQSILDLDGDRSSTPKKGWKRRGRVNVKGSSGKGQVGDPCLRSSDCSDSLCCARHFWTRICKPVLREGQVCTRQRRKGHQGLELFQRCSCGEGLACRALRDSSSQTPAPSSSLLEEALKSKFAASPSLSRHSSPHTSMLSASSSSSLGKSSSAVAKTRLHVCQRK